MSSLKSQDSRLGWLFDTSPTHSVSTEVIQRIGYWHVDEDYRFDSLDWLVIDLHHLSPTAFDKIAQVKSRFPAAKLVAISHSWQDSLELHNLFSLDILFDSEEAYHQWMQALLEGERSKKSVVDVREFKSINKFIHGLEEKDSLNSLVEYLNVEFQKYKGVKNVFLFSKDGGQDWLFFVQKGKGYKRLISQLGSQTLKIRVNDVADRNLLVSALSRPVGPLVGFPLLISSEAKRLGSEVPQIFFEHNLSSDQVDDFIRWTSGRIQSVAILLSRWLNQSFFETTSYEWEQIFDNLDHPIAVVDDEYNLLRANQRFKLQTNSSKCYEAFAGRSNPCINCKLGSEDALLKIERRREVRAEHFSMRSHPIKTSSRGRKAIFVNHYLDETRAQQLKKKIIQQEKMVALGHMAGHIAHELNNPLTGIHSLSQFLVAILEEGDSVKKDLIEVQSAAERCHKIVTNLLGFARGQDNFENLSLNEVVTSTLPLLKTIIHRHQMNIDLEDAPGVVSVDRHLLQQIFFNLINNACAAMLENGQIHISTWSENGRCFARVSDNGPGIPKELHEMIFEPFFTTKQKDRGTGLGLSMCQDIVKKYGGNLKLDSEYEGGASFVLDFPAVKDEDISH